MEDICAYPQELEYKYMKQQQDWENRFNELRLKQATHCKDCEKQLKQFIASELDAERDRIYKQVEFKGTVFNLNDELKAERNRVLEEVYGYIEHTNRCILSFLEAGEPTKNGGYRQKFMGEWYQAKPIDKTPKCNCGLDEILKSLKKE